jgi:hypothetical protein
MKKKTEANTASNPDECSRCRNLEWKIDDLLKTINNYDERQRKILTRLHNDHHNQMKAIIVAMKVLTKSNDKIYGNEMDWLSTLENDL